MQTDDVAAGGRRERKKRETRQALAAAALRLAVEKGPDNVTVEEISEAADVSVRTFFNYFPHKEHAILGRDPEDLERALARLRETPAEYSPLTTMRLLITRTLAEFEDEEGDRARQVALIFESPALLSQFVLLGAEDERALSAALAERMGAPPGAIAPALIVFTVIAAVRVCAEKLRQAGPELAGRTLSSLVDEAFLMIAHGVDPDYDPHALSRIDQEGQS
jgi:AcrR family transcriptional regulator